MIVWGIQPFRSVSRSHWKVEAPASPGSGLMRKQPGLFSPRTRPCWGGMAGWLTDTTADTKAPSAWCSQCRRFTKSRTETRPPPASAQTWWVMSVAWSTTCTSLASSTVGFQAGRFSRP